jgi:hypothetical protein
MFLSGRVCAMALPETHTASNVTMPTVAAREQAWLNHATLEEHFWLCIIGPQSMYMKVGPCAVRVKVALHQLQALCGVIVLLITPQ